VLELGCRAGHPVNLLCPVKANLVKREVVSSCRLARTERCWNRNIKIITEVDKMPARTTAKRTTASSRTPRSVTEILGEHTDLSLLRINIVGVTSDGQEVQLGTITAPPKKSSRGSVMFYGFGKLADPTPTALDTGNRGLQVGASLTYIKSNGW